MERLVQQETGDEVLHRPRHGKREILRRLEFDSMTNEQFETIKQLRHEGYAVVVWTQEELGKADPNSLEKRSIELGWQIIEDLK